MSALAALVAAAALAAAPAVNPPETSTNWAGYAAIPAAGAATSFTDVTGTWTQPAVRCVAGRSDAVAFWVGLGGYGEDSPALEQLGTAASCDGRGRAARHYVWWEIVPAPIVEVPLKLAPGDRVNAAVLVQGQKVTMSLKNLTRKTRFSKTVTVAQALDVDSAEWIAEAPARCSSRGRCTVVPLSDFGAVTFDAAAAIGDGHPGTIGDAAWAAAPIHLIADGDDPSRFFGRGDPLGPGVGAVPGALSPDGRSFTVSWARSVSPP